MKLPDEFGTFPFARFTAEEFRYFFCPGVPDTASVISI